MDNFSRFVTINTEDEARSLCLLIQEIVHGAEAMDIAQTFGCEFTCDNAGDLIDPDYTPMLGTWWAHFSFDWDHTGDVITKYVLKINPQVQTASEIITEYTNAVDYVKEHNPDFVALQAFLEIPTPTEKQRKDIVDVILRFDRQKFYEMDKRRDLAAGSVNRYVDYSGLESKLKYL